MMEPLKKQTKTKADIIIDFGAWKMDMKDCSVFADSGKDTIVVLFQDDANPERKIQIILRKEG